MRRLMLLRHAKSDWHSDVEADYDRPLNRRGLKAINKLAKAMHAHGIRPRFTLSSPARRAYQTVTELHDALEIRQEAIHYLPELYLADVDRLLDVIVQNPQPDIMIVGHNPGLEDLLTHLCGDGVPRTVSGKLLPTGSLAVISLPDDWTPASGRGRLERLLRPKELENEPAPREIPEEADT